MAYLDLLENSYRQEKTNGCDPDMGKLEFLAEYIFGFTTYENEVSSLMAEKALEVCEVISQRKTFDYIGSPEGNLWYLIMVNMPFFADKLEWGSSIRGAWWDLHGGKTLTIHSCGLYWEGEQVLDLSFDKDQWVTFLADAATFSKAPEPPQHIV